MPNSGPEILEMLEQVRQAALNYNDSEEHFPWGNRAFIRELKGNCFLLVNEPKTGLEVLLRLPENACQQALAHSFVELHKSMGYKNWIVVKPTNQTELELMLPWIATSYVYSKPVRHKADCLEDEDTTIVELLDSVRQAAMSYGDVEEFFPYGSRAFRKRKGQIFLYANEQGEYLNVGVRLPPDVRAYALNLPFVEIPKYIGPKGWVAANVSTFQTLETVLPWIDLSFDMNQPARKNKMRKRTL